MNKITFEKIDEIIENVCCDMMNLKIHKVIKTEYEKLLNLLYQAMDKGEILKIDDYEQIGSSNYRYNLKIHTGLLSEGGIYVGWKHNSSKMAYNGSYDLKVEFNPSKTNYFTNHDDGFKKIEFGNDDYVYEVFKEVFYDKVVEIREFDVAIDFLCKKEHIISLPLQGRQMNLFQGTKYYGQKHKDMYLKIYDKTKERQEKTGEAPTKNITRLEFTLRPDNGLYYYGLKSYQPNVNKIYLLALCTGIITNPAIRCQVYCLQSGHAQFSEFNHRQKKKIIDAIENELYEIDMNEIILRYWESIIKPISRWCFNSVDDKNFDDIITRVSSGDLNKNEFSINRFFEVQKILNKMSR